MIVVKGYKHIKELIFLPQNIVCYADFKNLADLLWLSKQPILPLFLKVVGFFILYSLFTYYEDCDLDMIYQILVTFCHLYN